MKKNEKSLLLKAVGESPMLKVIDFLIENKGMDFCKQDIAKGSGMSRTTLFHCWRHLEDAQIVIQTRKFGKAVLYKLNTKSPIVKKILELELALVNKFLDHEAQKATKKQMQILAE